VATKVAVPGNVLAFSIMAFFTFKASLFSLTYAFTEQSITAIVIFFILFALSGLVFLSKKLIELLGSFFCSEVLSRKEKLIRLL
jgi:hypothetical protein